MCPHHTGESADLCSKCFPNTREAILQDVAADAILKLRTRAEQAEQQFAAASEILKTQAIRLCRLNDELTRLRHAGRRAQAAIDILIAANEKHADPRCGHCAYALIEARAALVPRP